MEHKSLVKCEKCNKFHEVYKKHVCKKKDIQKALIERNKKDEQRKRGLHVDSKDKSLEKALGIAIIDEIKSYSYNTARLLEIREKIKSLCCKTTPTYGNLAAASSNSFNSNVEKIGDKRFELTKKETEIKSKLNEVTSLIENSGLTDREKELMWWIARTGNLQAFARRNHIGKDNVYKIRDRAIKKMLAYLGR